MLNKDFLVIDCEAIGLYGDSFSVGYVLVNRLGNCLLEGVIQTSADVSFGLEQNYKWVKENVNLDFPSHINVKTCEDLVDLRNEFWALWKTHKDTCYLAADCLFPVEALFLIDTVKLDEEKRQWQAPYPFIEIGTLLLACGKNPTDKYSRFADEMPEHNPLFDARQSARILIQCLNQLNL